MPAVDATDLTSHVRGLAEEAAADRDLYIVEVQVRGQKGSRVIEVYVDSDEGPGLDELAALSRDLDFVLETEDIVKGRYHLNVSSPGTDRPLKLPRQYRKHIGRQLQVVTGEPEAERTFAGTLTRVDDDSLTLEVDGEDARIDFADIAEARVLLPW